MPAVDANDRLHAWAAAQLSIGVDREAKTSAIAAVWLA